MSTDVVGFQGSMMRDMAEALTQWEQLNPPQGGEPKKPRNLVLLPLQFLLTPICSQLTIFSLLFCLQLSD